MSEEIKYKDGNGNIVTAIIDLSYVPSITNIQDPELEWHLDTECEGNTVRTTLIGERPMIEERR